MSKYLLSVAVLLVVCCMQSANAIRCYQCNALTDGNCKLETIDASMHIRDVDCDLQPKPNTMEEYLPVTRCNKVTTSDRAGKIVTRDCHFEVIGQKPNECRASGGRHVDECFTCTGDLCNAKSQGNGAVAVAKTAGYTLMGVAGVLATIFAL